jgi:hypothetical protein
MCIVISLLIVSLEYICMHVLLFLTEHKEQRQPFYRHIVFLRHTCCQYNNYVGKYMCDGKGMAIGNNKHIADSWLVGRAMSIGKDYCRQDFRRHTLSIGKTHYRQTM